jgi:alpha-tubulin suppressor-like RCC1 family protein
MKEFRLPVGPRAAPGAAVDPPAPRAITPKVAGGGNHTLLLGGDGQVYSCGNNWYGQLGQATMHQVVGTPTLMSGGWPAELAIIDIAAGDEHTLLLAENGQVYSCGDNLCGQLGQATMQQVVGTPAKMRWLSCPEMVITDIAAGGDHTLLLAKNGQVYSCGDNMCGELGYKREGPEFMPKLIDIKADIIGVAARNHHTLLLAENGQVYSCGDNLCGQLGQAMREREVGTLALMSGVGPPGVAITDIAAGDFHTLLLAKNGQIYSCGSNGSGQLGQKLMMEYNDNAIIITPQPMLTLDLA